MRKRYKRLSYAGWFTKPRIMLSGPNTGKVWKRYYGATSFDEALRTKTLVQNYMNCLSGIGLPALDTEIRITRSNKGTYWLDFFQPLVDRNHILHRYLKTCKRGEALSVFRNLMQVVDSMRRSNSQGNSKIGIDFGLTNVAVTEKGLVLFDLNPPYLSNAISIDRRALGKHMRSATIRLLSHLFPTISGNITESIADKRFDSNYVRTKIFNFFSAKRPELRQDFEEIIHSAP
jgi:hypothetical protein